MKRRLIQNVGRAMREALSGLEELANYVPEKAQGVLAGYPAVNVYERADAYVVRAEVAGVEAQDLDVTLEGTSVTIRGTEKEEAEYGGMTCHLCERDQGEFCRTVTLPDDVDEETEPEATLRQGVLTIKVPREQAARSKRVRVSEPEEEQADTGSPENQKKGDEEESESTADED